MTHCLTFGATLSLTCDDSSLGITRLVLLLFYDRIAPKLVAVGMYVNDNRQGHHVQCDGHPSTFSTATERDREPLAHHRLPTQTLLVYIKGLPRSSLSIEHSANQAGPWLHLFIPTIHSLSFQNTIILLQRCFSRRLSPLQLSRGSRLRPFSEGTRARASKCSPRLK